MRRRRRHTGDGIVVPLAERNAAGLVTRERVLNQWDGTCDDMDVNYQSSGWPPARAPCVHTHRLCTPVSPDCPVRTTLPGQQRQRRGDVPTVVRAVHVRPDEASGAAQDGGREATGRRERPRSKDNR
eukprot:gene15119-biopygen17152